MNHAGEIRTLVGIAEPDVRVWTNVGDAHLGFFASPDAIADAKAEILESASADTVLVANADDARVMKRAASFAGRLVTFGTAARADVRAEQVVFDGLNGVRARVVTPAGSYDLDTPLLLAQDPVRGGYRYDGPLLQPWHGAGLDMVVDSPPQATVIE